jgi:hypothetical protein
MDIVSLVSFGGLLLAWMALPIKKTEPIGAAMEKLTSKSQAA